MKRRRPNVIIEFSGQRPEGDIFDGAQAFLDELGDIPDDELTTLDEIEVLRAKSDKE